MEPRLNLRYTKPDIVILRNLIEDFKCDCRGKPGKSRDNPPPEVVEETLDNEQGLFGHDQECIRTLEAYNDPRSKDFAPTIFTTWDEKDIPVALNDYLVKSYARMAMGIVRHPTDVVFLTHIILYLTVNLGSAVWLFHRFTYFHGVLHTLYTFSCMGPFTLLMHNHIHNNGVLAKQWKWLDCSFPYVWEPLMGHTWNSYYYHHVKHHHVENNGKSSVYRLGRGI